MKKQVESSSLFAIINVKKKIYEKDLIFKSGSSVRVCGDGGVVDAKKNEKAQGPKDECTTIQNGSLTYSAGHYLDGNQLEVGFDVFGYNYQGHMFNGTYANIYLGRSDYGGNGPYNGDDDSYLEEYPAAESTWMWPYRTDFAAMKWNDAWISNKDCDDDGKLDRHAGYSTYIGSGAWLTNHMRGEYEEENGKTCKWTYFTKIVAAPVDAYKEDGVWYAADDSELGPVIWESFATIQEVSNDQCNPDFKYSWHGPRPGLGNWESDELMEIITIPVTNGGGIETNFSTEEGQEYRLEASGTYRFANWGEYGIADAEWAYRNDGFSDPNSEGWTPGETTYPSIRGLDVLVNDDNVDWGDFNTLHQYSFEYVGTGAPIKFSIYDSAYGDNAPINDGLVVKIYKVQ